MCSPGVVCRSVFVARLETGSSLAAVIVIGRAVSFPNAVPMSTPIKRIKVTSVNE